MAPRGGHAVAANSGSEDDDEEAGFSRSYFLAKEKEPSSGKKRARAAGKLSDLNLVDEQVLRASLAEIPPKHEKELEALTRSYKDQYRNWLFELSDGNKKSSDAGAPELHLFIECGGFVSGSSLESGHPRPE